MDDLITIRGARLHNLKNITLSLPKNKLVVLTGVSGSGKSTLGMDILFKEGQRQFMAALGMVEYGLTHPPVDSISGLTPTISVDQHLTNRSPRSTFGTATDVYTYLRILFSRLGHHPCLACGKGVPPAYDTGMEWEEDAAGDELSAGTATFPCPHCGAPNPLICMAFFSFNKPAGACPTCGGLGTVHQVDVQRLLDEQKSILDGAVAGWARPHIEYYSGILRAAANYYHIDMDLAQPVNTYPPAGCDLLLYGVENPQFRRHFPGIEPPPTARRGRFEGIATSLLRRYAGHIQEHVNEEGYRDQLEDFLVTDVCPDCTGTRLRPESRSVTVNGKDITELSRLPLTDLREWLLALPTTLTGDEQAIAAPILHALHERIERLVETGDGYLTLERASPSLSAGESQRLRLASLLGSSLGGLLYVFDEPSIGLHARDTHRLIGVLKRLRDLGNTILVIEHDLEIINAADYVVDFGPGAGRDGGQIMAAGTPTEIARSAASLTGDYLSGRASIPIPLPRKPGGKSLVIRGARQHNLQNITVQLPLGLLTAVTGVSGSGKSSLVFDILDRAVRKRLYGAGDPPGEHDAIEGVEHLDKIITIDQEHIGRIPRSNAATYTEVFTSIRSAFAATAGARARGFTARHFSFNVPGGRCERCEGTGVLTIRMQLLPDAEVRCPVCHGKRFNPQTLEVRFNGYDISSVLDMTIEEALPVFKDVPAARSRLQVLNEVGLGYLQLGQPAVTLSGGEAQRVKLARELGRRASGRTLYLLDEPTTGMHLADTARLLGVLQRLVDAGNTVVVVEHNLDLVKAVDWVIDLGPEGGSAGGRLIAEGTPEQIAHTPRSYTGERLKELIVLSK